MAQYDIDATGASAEFSQAQPKLGPQDLLSLTELAVLSSDERQVIEIGWIVSPSVNKDSRTHLFVYHWVNGIGTCFNACGFVAVSKKFRAGGPVTVGRVGTYAIQFHKDRWLVNYDGVELGYFPLSLWKAPAFKSVGEVQVFGEVDSPSATTPRSQMGNGVLGTNPKSASIRDVRLIGGTAIKPFAYFSQEAPTKYRIGLDDPTCVTSCGMHFGGPGFS